MEHSPRLCPFYLSSFLFISQLLRLGNCQWSRENQRKQRPPKKERRKRTKDMFQTVENNQNKVRNKEQTKKKKSKIRFKNKKTTLEFIAFLCAAFPPAFLVSWGFSSTCQYYFVVIIIHYCSTWVWSNKFQVRDSPTVKRNEKKGPWVFGECNTHFCFPQFFGNATGSGHHLRMLRKGGGVE